MCILYILLMYSMRERRELRRGLCLARVGRGGLPAPREKGMVIFMYVWIDNKSGAPIYDQIYTQIKNQIISGQLGPDEMLPSIRNLAKDLRISVITTKRAYEELEKEGFIYTVAAKGCFVAPKNTELLREEHLKRMEAHLQEAIALAASCGLGEKEVAALLHTLYEEV